MTSLNKCQDIDQSTPKFDNFTYEFLLTNGVETQFAERETTEILKGQATEKNLYNKDLRQLIEKSYLGSKDAETQGLQMFNKDNYRSYSGIKPININM